MVQNANNNNQTAVYDSINLLTLVYVLNSVRNIEIIHFTSSSKMQQNYLSLKELIYYSLCIPAVPLPEHKIVEQDGLLPHELALILFSTPLFLKPCLAGMRNKAFLVTTRKFRNSFTLECPLP